MFEIPWICNCVKEEKYYFSKHADTERQNDDIEIKEIEEAILNGRIILILVEERVVC